MKNPFEFIRTEEFNNNFELITKLFQEPSEFDKILGRGNVILEGARGSGKTMILKYLSIEAQVAELVRFGRASSSYDKNFVGIYLRIDAGPFKPFMNDPEKKEEMELLFSHYFNMLVCERILRSLIWANKNGVFQLGSETEETIVKQILSRLKIDWGTLEDSNSPLDSLISLLESEQNAVSDHLNRSVVTGAVDYKGTFTDIRKFLYSICEILYKAIPFLHDGQRRFYLLLDEYDHLYLDQQRAINTVVGIREHPLCFKIGTRIGGMKTYNDLSGQQLMRPHDYERILLDYKPNSAIYIKYIERIADARLKAANVPLRIRELLPGISVEEEMKGILTKDEIADGYDLIKSRILELLEERNIPKEKCGEYLENYYKTYKHAILFQELSHRRPREKDYSGFSTYVMLSSGIIRSFIELCKKAVSLALSRQIDIYAKQCIPQAVQTEAAMKVSEEYYSDVRRIDLYGLQLQVLCRAFAAIFRRKLLDNKLRDPETLHLELMHPQTLSVEMKNLLDAGVFYSVIHSVSPYKPRQIGFISEAYRLNRIFVPYFGLSYRDRWRVVCPAVLLNDILQEPEVVVDKLTQKTANEIMLLMRSQPTLLEYSEEKREGAKEDQIKLKIEAMPGTINDRVFVGGNYDYMATLREVKKYVLEAGFVPILAFDFDVPLHDIHDYDLRLLHNCKYAIFDETHPAGELMEMERVRDYGVDVIVVYQIRDPSQTEPPPQITNMLTTLKCGMHGYLTFNDLREKIIQWLQKSRQESSKDERTHKS